MFRRPWLAVVILLVSTSGAAADWLVLTDGQRLEIQGPHEVRGKQVRFTTQAGQLSSLPLAEIDLEATRKANEPPPPPPPPPPPKKPVLVLTDADVSHVDPSTIQPYQAPPGPVILYTTSWCGVCHKAKAYLTELKVPFVEKDVEKNRQAAVEFLSKGRGGSGVPLIEIDGAFYRGFSASWIDRALEKRKGKTVG
jgi:glutaredoxin